MVAFLKRMPAGIPGALTRQGKAKVEPFQVWPQGTTGAFSAYGLAGQLDAVTGQFRVVKSTDATVRGFLVRPFPTGGNTGAGAALGGSVTPPDGVGDAMVSGYINAKLYGATAAVRGGVVYVRVADVAATGFPIGSVQAAAQAAPNAADTIALPATSYFEGPADANGNVEIAFNV